MQSATQGAYGVFQQPWWLDAAAPGMWDAVEVQENGALVARLPYVLKRRQSLSALTMPPLTQWLGPWLHAYGSGQKARLAREKELIGRLIDGLPAHDFYRQSLHPSLTNWQPFYWRGYRQTTLYTYIIEDLSDLDRVFAGFESRKRRDIKRAAKSLRVKWDLPPDDFYDHLTTTLSRRGDTPVYPRELFLRVHGACLAREQGRIIHVEDGSGEIHAASFLVWDETSAYLLVTSFDPKWRDNGSGSLVIWEAIKACAEVTQQFNLEGSMIEGVERSYRAFGGRHVPYLFVTNASRRGRIVQSGRELVNAFLGRPGDGLR